jgi:hypothetical protein
MPINELAAATADEILTAVGGDAAKAGEVSRIIEKALIRAMQDTHSSYVNVVNHCCGADQDLAHKIAAELKHERDALVSNLSSMR